MEKGGKWKEAERNERHLKEEMRSKANGKEREREMKVEKGGKWKEAERNENHKRRNGK